MFSGSSDRPTQPPLLLPRDERLKSSAFSTAAIALEQSVLQVHLLEPTTCYSIKAMSWDCMSRQHFSKQKRCASTKAVEHAYSAGQSPKVVNKQPKPFECLLVYLSMLRPAHLSSIQRTSTQANASQASQPLWMLRDVNNRILNHASPRSRLGSCGSGFRNVTMLLIGRYCVAHLGNKTVGR